ncbi:TM221 protein, partial [Campylorhamphus procurvoides]|nr:TM221 protein [Campylorhamphus procurvoides]
RAEWFLLDSRKVRHAAIGLFCCGIAFYLTALALYMVLALELRAGIPGACILSSGILVLLITVTHTLLQASCLSRQSHPGASRSLCDNKSSSRSDLSKNAAAPRSRQEIQRKFSFPAFLERK